MRFYTGTAIHRGDTGPDRQTIITFRGRQQSELWKWNRTKATNGRICSTSCVVYDDMVNPPRVYPSVYVAAFRNINIKDLNSTVDTFVVVVGWRNWNISNPKSPKDKWTTFNRLSVSAESGGKGYSLVVGFSSASCVYNIHLFIVATLADYLQGYSFFASSPRDVSPLLRVCVSFGIF